MCHCRQPSGGVIALPHSSWVTLISQDLVAASAKNVNPMVAEAVSEGPISIYTEMRIYYCTYNSFVCIFFLVAFVSSQITSQSAYVATETELDGAKIDGLLPPNFL